MNSLQFPNFKFSPDNIVADLTVLLDNNKQQIEVLLQQKQPTWENLIAPIETLEDKLNQFWSPISHLNSVTDNADLRQAYNVCLPLLSNYTADMGQNQALFKAYQTIKTSANFNELDYAQQAVINYALRDFRLSGIDLNADERQQYKSLSSKLSSLSTKFSENILDTTKLWQKYLTDEAELSGLSEQRRYAAQEAAAEKNLSGWLLTLDYPCYHDVMTFSDSSTLREEFYYAFNTRASDQGPHGTHYDNSIIMQQLLQHRNEIATLLGFKNYAELSLQPKMAKSPQQVLDFLNNLLQQVKPVAKIALQNLQEFSSSSIKKLNPWDVAYYSEKLRQEKYTVNAEEIRAYFPAATVSQGLFTIVNKLYGITLKSKKAVAWHDDVIFYEIYNEDNTLIGGVYFDLYARDNKRGGAWMDELVSRRKLDDGKLQLPIALLNCNFAAATKNKPALLTHQDVITLFHEFGHCLQHLLTKVDYLDVSGINNVPWDAVEFPSQFFEAWCWNKESLCLLSCHYESKKTLPDELIEKLIAAKNFQAGLFLIRQLEFALFDMHLHINNGTQKDTVQHTLTKIRAEVAVIPVPDYNRFSHSFSHIFSGGYAAGYYSYLWAEVLARDAFSIFKKTGIFNHALGEKFKNTVLAEGGSLAPEALFRKFMQRDPDTTALLAYYGLANN